MSGRPPSKRARHPSLSQDCEDDYDEHPAQSRHHDQYQDKWDELANVRTLAESNSQRINEMDQLVQSFGAYKMSDDPAPTSYYEQFEVQNSYFDNYEIPRQSYEMPTASYEMARSSCVVRPTYMQDFGTSGYVPHMPSHSSFDNPEQFRTRSSSSNDFLGTAITHQSHPVPSVSTFCGALINEEHFHTPSSESDAPMEDTDVPHVPAPHPGLMERWTSKRIFNPFSNKRSGKKK